MYLLWIDGYGAVSAMVLIFDDIHTYYSGNLHMINTAAYVNTHLRSVLCRDK